MRLLVGVCFYLNKHSIIISSSATCNSRINTRKVIKMDSKDALELHVILGAYLMIPTNINIKWILYC